MTEATDATETDAPQAARRKRRRIVVGGIGLPWLRDLDSGTQFIRRIEGEPWPKGVYVEDMSYAGHRVLDRLKEIRPHKVILVGAMPRDVAPAGTIRRYKLDIEPIEEPDADLQERLAEAASGIIDLDHTLAIVRWGKGFPADTVVIEVEPGDRSFGLGFSDEVEATVDEVLTLVREEVAAGRVAAPAGPANVEEAV